MWGEIEGKVRREGWRQRARREGGQGVHVKVKQRGALCHGRDTNSATPSRAWASHSLQGQGQKGGDF